MKKLPALSWLLLGIAFAVCGCSQGGGDDALPSVAPSSPEDGMMAISISAVPTRVTETAFEQGDAVGLFVVNRAADGSPQPLNVKGNHVDNMRFAYADGWTPDKSVYWKDAGTHADFYLYHPFESSVGSVSAMPFGVCADQGTVAAHKASDLLVGLAKDVAPTKDAVGINARHVLSRMVVRLAAGNGLDGQDVMAADVRVKINGLRTNATVDLATAAVTAVGQAVVMTPCKTADGYEAFVVPQDVDGEDLITVVHDGVEYNFTKAMSFESGSTYAFAVTLEKDSRGISVGVTKWDDDGVDYGGVAE